MKEEVEGKGEDNGKKGRQTETGRLTQTDFSGYQMKRVKGGRNEESFLSSTFTQFS